MKKVLFKAALQGFLLAMWLIIIESTAFAAVSFPGWIRIGIGNVASLQYPPTMAAAANAGNSRAGANPLIIKAVGTTSKIVNKCDVVVSVEDGNKILMENTRSSFLSQYAVVFQR